jgi:hypothetical protein
MSISRTGACPPFLEYVTKQALIPRSGVLTPEFLRLTRYSFRWIGIPSYQRGLVWNEDLFEDLLASNSVFLGNAILGSFAVPVGSPLFVNLPSNVTTYEILIDGLQRFSIGTALLKLLFPMVLKDNPERPNDAPHFAALKAQSANLAPIFQHNDFELEHHTRTAVAASYRNFRDVLSLWLTDQFDRGQAGKIAEKLLTLFLVRQIAPDTYYGFTNEYEVTNTFIGLNTIRVQLSIIDWLRSIIVDRGSASGWSSAETEMLENRFTEVFTKEGIGPESDLIPLAAIVKDSLIHSDVKKAISVFPTWQTGLLLDDVNQFLNFVEAMFDSKDNPYYREIRSCGAIPLAGCICHYYRIFLAEGSTPSFLSGGTTEDLNLKALLRAYYRVVFDGHVARTRGFAERLLHENISLPTVADELSIHFLGRGLDLQVDRDWLVSTLKQADKRRARQVFNACFLAEMDTLGSFAPQLFGKSDHLYQIDHMIPESVIQSNLPGGSESRLLTNFAPIRRPTNIRQLNVPCHQKLGPGGTYAAECQNDPLVHPYVEWLVANQGDFWNQLDMQELLQALASPGIGDQRIQWLADWLIKRL